MAETTVSLDDIADRFAMEQAIAAVSQAEVELEQARQRSARVAHAIAKRKCPNAPPGPFRMVASRDGRGLDAIVFTVPVSGGDGAAPTVAAPTAAATATPSNGGTSA